MHEWSFCERYLKNVLYSHFRCVPVLVLSASHWAASRWILQLFVRRFCSRTITPSSLRVRTAWSVKLLRHQINESIGGSDTCVWVSYQWDACGKTSLHAVIQLCRLLRDPPVEQASVAPCDSPGLHLSLQTQTDLRLLSNFIKESKSHTCENNTKYVKWWAQYSYGQLV